jgi:ketosteroid isomerase-like protein
MADSESAQLSLRSAMEDRDLERALDAFAADAVVRSPFTERLAFEGREQIRAILGVVLETFESFHYTSEAREGDRALLVSRARVGGQELEIADHIVLDASGKIREFTVFFRPLPGSAAALRVIGAGLARRRSPARAALISVLARPLGFLTRTADAVGVALVRPTL